MEAVKKSWLWGIFISILTVFAMSYNASAISPVIDLSNYELVSSRYATALSCEWVNMRDTISSGNNYCRGTINNTTTVSGLTYIYSTDTYSVKKGDILTFYMLLQSWNETQPNSTQLLTLTNSQLGWNVLDYTVQDEGQITPELVASGYVNPAPNNDMAFNGTYYSGFYKLYQITLIAVQDGNLHFGLNNTTNNRLFSWNVNDDYGKQINVKLSDFKLYRFSGDEANKEQQQKTQDAADASETAGGNSSSDAQTGTTSLINAITGAVTVISSASPTNCKINGNMGNLDMGQLDLCANPAPAFVTTIGSLILILMCVPLAITLFNRFISLFRSFQS